VFGRRLVLPDAHRRRSVPGQHPLYAELGFAELGEYLTARHSDRGEHDAGRHGTVRAYLIGERVTESVVDRSAEGAVLDPQAGRGDGRHDVAGRAARYAARRPATSGSSAARNADSGEVRASISEVRLIPGDGRDAR